MYYIGDDMDKLLKPVCRGDYDEKCFHCGNFKKERKKQAILCEKKQRKRKNIQRGCGKLAGICRALELPGKSLTWDLDMDSDWAGHIKGVDDYLCSLNK